MSGNTVGTFFKNRLKSTKLHTYSATGDLVTKDKSGAVISTITIPTYRPPTEDEVAAMETNRLERITVAQEAFESARRTMRAMVAEGITSNIRRAMAAVTRADTRLQAARYAEKFIEHAIGEYEVREINLEDSRNTSKTVNPGLLTGAREPIEHYLFRATPFSPQDIFCRVATPEEAAASAVGVGAAAGARAAPKARTVLIISQPSGDTGYMSSWYPATVMCRGHMYKTAYQAILAELALVFNEEDISEEIRTAATPEEINFTVEDAEEATEESWNRELDTLLVEVNRAKFTRNPELADLLINTGRSILGYVPPEDPTDVFQGIGLDAENSDATNFRSWTGQNKFGIALGVIRKELTDARRAAGAAAPRTAVLRRKPVASAAASAVGSAASAVGSAASAVGSAASAAASAVGSAVGSATGAVADSLIDLFTPVPTPATPGAAAPE